VIAHQKGGFFEPFSRRDDAGDFAMVQQAESLRKAIENLIDAKLVDALARPDGLSRLLAHRRTGVATPDIRSAERRLEQTLDELLEFHAEQHAEQAA
jgi:hypothetical protein